MMGELEKQLYEEEGEDETQGAPPQQLPTPAPASCPMQISPPTPPQASPMEVSLPSPAKGPPPVPQPKAAPVVPPPAPMEVEPQVNTRPADDDRVIMLQRQLDDTQMMLKMLLSKIGSGEDPSMHASKAAASLAAEKPPQAAPPAASTQAAVAPDPKASLPDARTVPPPAAAPEPKASIPSAAKTSRPPAVTAPAASLAPAAAPNPQSSVPTAAAPDPQATSPAASGKAAAAPDPEATTPADSSKAAVAPDPKAPSAAAPAPDPKATAPAASVQAAAPESKAAAPPPAPANEETEEDKNIREEKERLRKKAHADWMRYSRSLRLWVLRHLFEVWTSAKEEWMESSIVVNARSKTAKRRRGKFVWKKYCDLLSEMGEGTASAIKLHKMEVDPQCTGKHWMLHPDLPEREDWQMFRVFDSKAETEESDSEEERIYETGASFTGAAEKKPGKGKSVANQARDHVSKGALKIVDADSTATYAEAMVKDMAEPIQELKAAMAELQGSLGKVPEERLSTCNDRVTEAFKQYDNQVAPLRRAMSMSKPKTPKPKKSGKNGVPGYLGKTPTHDVNGQPWDSPAGLRFAATAEDEVL
ncbi:unnamed protein product [Symbiodinium sp. KB8]|nr:unnamed protein product [Symbiodinium sp. KB8]